MVPTYHELVTSAHQTLTLSKGYMLDFENIEVAFLKCAGAKIGKNPIPGGLPTSVRKHDNGYTVSLRFQ